MTSCSFKKTAPYLNLDNFPFKVVSLCTSGLLPALLQFYFTLFLTIYTFVFYKFNQNFGVDGRQWCKSSVSGYETFFLFLFFLIFPHVVIVFCTLIFFPRDQTVTVD